MAAQTLNAPATLPTSGGRTPGVSLMPVTNPKLCECGCGQPAPIADKTERARGYVKGEPRRFVTGHNTPTRDVEERFWEKVDVRGPDECWEWQASLRPDGYGNFGHAEKSAHRTSYALTYGDIPMGAFVLHACDNPACVNPHHLSLGDAAENARQAVERGRSCVGERHGHARLTETKVLEARNLVRGGKQIKTLAGEYGVHPTTLREAVHGTTWKHLPGAVVPLRKAAA